MARRTIKNWLSLSSHNWNHSLAALGLLLAACGGVSGPDAPVPWDSPRSLEVLGDLALLESDGPLDSPVRPQSLVAVAMESALAAVAPPEEASEVEASSLGDLPENRGTSAHLEAWLRLDEAHVFARLAAEPLPEPDPVSVETQRLSREGDVPPGELHLYVPALGERGAIRLFDTEGRMRPSAVREVSRLLRDRRDERTRTIEPRLLTMMYLVGQYYDAELEVVSGYRIRGENATRGSRHGSGHACDFRISGVGTRTLTRMVEGEFASVGVGYYPTSRFVHLDHRTSSYYWIDRSGPGQRSRTRSRTPGETPRSADDVTLRSVHITERELYVPPPIPLED